METKSYPLGCMILLQRIMMINYNQSDLNLLDDLHDIVGQDYETGKHD